MTELAKRTFYQYLTAFHLTMAIFLFLAQSYGMPETLEQAAVYVAVAVLGAWVYSTDKKTGVEKQKVELTPIQEYDIKKWFELICSIFGLKITVEKPADTLPVDPVEPVNPENMSKEQILELLKSGKSDSGRSG